MARQIKSFKRKLRKVSEWCDTEENEMKDTKPCFEAAYNIIQQNTKLAPADHKDLLPNLIKALSSERLSPGSLGFDRICSLVRSKLPQQSLNTIKSNDEFCVNVTIDNRKVPITSQEYDLVKDFRKDTETVQLL
mmetsp:Transcript_18811/g.16652  ORF Transcript_18811/g.16652 Transcript_18811/m.16652 type:complete len:134 (+) Transcript_18811:247-648(+)